MLLTERAKKFLNRQEYRADAVKSEELIRQAFNKIGKAPVQALIDFQLNYGGLMIYAGLEPICFGILHGDMVRGDFYEPERIIHDFIHYPPDEDSPLDHLTCADTLYQELFTLDFEGKYYEGYTLVATRFEHQIEDLAVFDEIVGNGHERFERIYIEDLQTHLDFEQVKKELELFDYPDYTQDVKKWACNEQLYVGLSHDTFLMISKEGFTETQQAYLQHVKELAAEVSNQNPTFEDLTTLQGPVRQRKSGFWERLKGLWS